MILLGNIDGIWAQRFEYGALGILKHLPIKPQYVLVIVLIFKFSTLRPMTYICC